MDRVGYNGVTNPERRLAWTQDLQCSCEGMSIGIVHVAATLTNEGREDGLVVGGTAATFSVAGSAWTGSAWQMGTRVTQFDVDSFGVAKAAGALAVFYSAGVPIPEVTYILCNSAPALQATRNPRNKKAQEHALLFHHSLMTLCLNHGNVRVILLWAPEDPDSEGRQRARALAAEVCKRRTRDELTLVNTAAFHKDLARKQAFLNWGTEWLVQNNRLTLQDFGNNTWVCKHPPRPHQHPSFARAHTVTRPPDGKNHPLWRAATDREKDEKGKKTGKPLYTRRTTSTTLQLAVDHAFTGTYAIRFRTSDPEEASECPCRAPFRTDTHTFYDCPRLALERHLSRMTYNGTRTRYHAIYHSRASHVLLDFLQKSRALSRLVAP